MYVHIGNNRIINEKRIIGLFDIDTTSRSESTKKLLSEAEKEGRLSLCDDGIPKTFILTDDDGVYFTRISARTIADRIRGRHDRF